MEVARERRSYRQSRKKPNNNLGGILVCLVAVCFLVVMGFRIQALSASYRRYNVRYESQQRELQAERQRSEELKEKKAAPQTDADIEKLAREQLGLIRPGEILLKPNK